MILMLLTEFVLHGGVGYVGSERRHQQPSFTTTWIDLQQATILDEFGHGLFMLAKA